MAGIYTGNLGRIYIARRTASGLLKNAEFTVEVAKGQKLTKDQRYGLFTTRGGGRGAVVVPLATVTADATTRTVKVKVVSEGKNYESSDRVFLYIRNKDNSIRRMTKDFTTNSTGTRGVDNEKELLGSNDRHRIAKVQSWNFTSNSEVIETTALGDTVKSYLGSATSGEGSATLMFYEDEMSGLVETEREHYLDTYELTDILFPRSEPPLVLMSLCVDGSPAEVVGTGGKSTELFKSNFVFNAYITSAAVSASYGEVVTIETSFTIDGALINVPYKPGAVRI